MELGESVEGTSNHRAIVDASSFAKGLSMGALRLLQRLSPSRREKFRDASRSKQQNSACRKGSEVRCAYGCVHFCRIATYHC